MRRTTSRLGAVAAAAVLTLTAACGGDDGGDDSGFTDQSAEEIADAAKDAMGELEAVAIAGTLTSDGQEIELDLHIGTDGNCEGTFSTGGASAEILGVDGTMWFRPDAAFWQLSAGEAADKIIAEVGDKWVTLPADDTSFKQFCDLEEFLGELIADEGSTYTKGEVSEIEGDDAIAITSKDEEEGESIGYVLVEGDHYLVQIAKEEGDEPGEVNFSKFDEQPEVEEPADQIPLDELEAAVS